MLGFRFAKSNSFEINWEAFLVEMESVDARMADIFRANKDKLVSVVCWGNRSTLERADFNYDRLTSRGNDRD